MPHLLKNLTSKLFSKKDAFKESIYSFMKCSSGHAHEGPPTLSLIAPPRTTWQLYKMNATFQFFMHTL